MHNVADAHRARRQSFQPLASPLRSFLIATVARLENKSSSAKQTTYPNPNRNKFSPPAILAPRSDGAISLECGGLPPLSSTAARTQLFTQARLASPSAASSITNLLGYFADINKSTSFFNFSQSVCGSRPLACRSSRLGVNWLAILAPIAFFDRFAGGF